MQISTAQMTLLALMGAIATFGCQPNGQANVGIQPSPEPALVSASEPSPDPLTQPAVEAAPFVAVAHPTTGAAKVIEVDGQRYLELDEAFSTDSGPDLFVLLHREAVPENYQAANYINLGQMQQFSGMQRYAIPPEVDLATVKSAVIWCRQFDVTFGYATL